MASTGATSVGTRQAFQITLGQSSDFKGVRFEVFLIRFGSAKIIRFTVRFGWSKIMKTSALLRHSKIAHNVVYTCKRAIVMTIGRERVYYSLHDDGYG